MRHKSIMNKHRYDIYDEELKAYFTEHYDAMPVVIKMDCLIDAIADLNKELEKQQAIHRKSFGKKSYK